MKDDKNFRKLKNWQDTHLKLLKTVIRGKNIAPDKIADYFLYNNLKKTHPDFCPLYRSGEVCHKDIDRGEFSCLFCGCPFFNINGLGLNEYGICKSLKNSGSRLKNGFWDCSGCGFVHKNTWVKENIDKITHLF